MKRASSAAILFTLFSSLYLPAATHAANLAEGVYEVRMEANWDVLYDGHDQAVPLRGGLGYYLSDQIQIGGLISFSKKEIGSFWGVDDVWGLGLFGEYNFPSTSPLVPYSSASLSMLDGNSGGDSVIVLAASGGIKYFITRTVALFAQLNINLATDEIYDFDRDDDIPDEVDGSGSAFDVSTDLGVRIVLW